MCHAMTSAGHRAKYKITVLYIVVITFIFGRFKLILNMFVAVEVSYNDPMGHVDVVRWESSCLVVDVYT